MTTQTQTFASQIARAYQDTYGWNDDTILALTWEFLDGQPEDVRQAYQNALAAKGADEPEGDPLCVECGQDTSADPNRLTCEGCGRYAHDECDAASADDGEFFCSNCEHTGDLKYY